MRQIVLGLAILVSAASLTACGGDGGDGSGGNGASGGTAGDGGTPEPLSLNEETAISATAGAATAMAAAAELGAALGAVFQSAGDAFSELGFRTKQLALPCSGGGTADVEGDPFSSVEITLNDCAGLGVGDQPVSGTVTFVVDQDLSAPPSILVGRTTLDLDVGSQRVITGSLLGRVDLGRFGSVVLTLGNAEDGDRIDVTQNGATVLTLGCFEITLFFDFAVDGVRLSWITPFSAASIRLPTLPGQQVYTISDYAVRLSGAIRQVNFDQFRLPWSGELSFFSGDNTAMDDERSAACAVFTAGGTTVAEGDGSTFVATFSQEQVGAPPRGGCIKITGDAGGDPFELETTWDKVLAGDVTPGAGPSCFAAPAESEGFEGCPAEGDIEVAADAYVRGDGPEGMFSQTNFGNAPNLLVKSSSNNYFNRKTYLGFELAGAPPTFERALVVLTLERHVGRRPIDVYGLPGFSWTETGITWANAPANESGTPNSFDDPAEILISSDPLDLAPFGEDDPAGTKYAFDVTELVRENGNSSMTVMITNPTIENTDGSTFVSKEAEDPCARPFLHFE